ncbi:MAG: hypothetical protein AAF404_20905 [Pseudomonadota bacterium]
MVCRIPAIACLASMLGACSVADFSAAQNPNIEVAKQMTVEPVKDPVYDAGKVRFTAISNGCTASSDFLVEYAVDENTCELTIIRHQPDYCRKASMPVDLELEWLLPVSCAGLPIVFQNPELDDPEVLPGRRLRDARSLEDN